MKQKKLAAMLMVLLACAFGMFGMTSLAAGDGSQSSPYVGGHDYQKDDGKSIVLHKLDIAGFEREKAAELIAADLLGAGGTVTYTGNIPTGAVLTGGSIIGSYTTSESSDQEPVTLAELSSLGNITFRIEQVQLNAGSTPGSTNPDDYALVTDGIDGYAKTDSAGQIIWSGLATSYYRITEEVNETGQPVGPSSYIAAVPMVDPADASKTINTIHIYPKNRASEGPDIVKDQPRPEDFNGNVLSWTIRAEIPANLKAEMGSQHYAVTDTMSAGLSFAGNLKVYYLHGGNEVELTNGTEYTSDAAAGDTSFTITLTSAGFTLLGGALESGEIDSEGGRYTLYVTYDTIVNISPEDLEANIDPNNKVTLDFTNSEGTEYKDEPDPVVVDYAGMKVIKKDGSNETVLLPGAKFKVYTRITGGQVDEASVLKDISGNEIEFTTDAEGQFKYIGLGEGTYYIVETQAPDNYKKLSSYTEIVITADDVEDHIIKEGTVLNYLDNGFTLPSTGGTGTLLITIAGVLLLAAAGAVLIFGRKGMRK